MKTLRLLSLIAIVLPATLFSLTAVAQQPQQPPTLITTKPNLAIVATTSGPNRGGGSLATLNDGFAPVNQGRGGGGGNRQQQPRSMYWVQYEWKQPVSTKEIAVYWWNFNNGLRLPEAYRIKYWDGTNFVPVTNISGLGLTNNQLNASTFDEVKTTRLRLELDSADRFSATLLEWIVYPSANSAPYPPVVVAGVDRDVMAGGKTYLAGSTKAVTSIDKISWVKTSGPGDVVFNNPASKEGTAVISTPGEYILTMTATEGGLSSSSALKVMVHQPP